MNTDASDLRVIAKLPEPERAHLALAIADTALAILGLVTRRNPEIAREYRQIEIDLAPRAAIVKDANGTSHLTERDRLNVKPDRSGS